MNTRFSFTFNTEAFKPDSVAQGQFNSMSEETSLCVKG